MRDSKEFRAMARQGLSGKWGISVLVTFVAGLLGGGLGGNGAYNGSSVRNAMENAGYGIDVESIVHNPIIFSTIMTVLSFTAILSIAMLIVGAAVELGHARYYLGLMGGESPEFGILFSRFRIFLKAVGLRLYMGLFTFLWSLLFIVPGIVAAYRYSMAPYLMAQYPEKGIRECVEDSKALMSGHKGRLFFLNLSFIGWALLCVLTFGIGALWLNPYTNAAQAAFYLERTNQLGGQEPDDGTWQPQT